MGRTNQGGSVLSFLVIGSVMVLLLVGGAFAIRHFLASPNGSAGVVSRQDENKSQSGSGSAGDTLDQPSKDTKSSDEKNSEPKTGGNDGNASEQAEEPAPSSEPVNKESNAPGDLPTTGPEDAVLEGIFLSSLVAFAVAYLRSRQHVTSL